MSIVRSVLAREHKVNRIDGTEHAPVAITLQTTEHEVKNAVPASALRQVEAAQNGSREA
jgi:hypothetical protein